MDIIYRKYALLWNSKGDFYNKILLEELKNQIINKDDDIKLYNCMPFYHDEILKTLLNYKKRDNDNIKYFIYMNICRDDLLDEEFINKMKNKNIRSIVNLELNNKLFNDTNVNKNIYEYLDNNDKIYEYLDNIDLNFDNGYFIKKLINSGKNILDYVKDNFIILSQIINNGIKSKEIFDKKFLLTKYEYNDDIYNLLPMSSNKEEKRDILNNFYDILNSDNEIIENNGIFDDIKENDSIFDVTYKIIKTKKDIEYNEIILFINFWINIYTYEVNNNIIEDFKFNYPNIKIFGSIKLIDTNRTYIHIDGENKKLFRYLTHKISYYDSISFDLIHNYSFIRILKYIDIYLKNRNIIYSDDIKEYGFPNYLLPYQICGNDKVSWIFKYPSVERRLILQFLEIINLNYNNVCKEFLDSRYRDKNNIEMILDSFSYLNDINLFTKYFLSYNIYYVFITDQITLEGHTNIIYIDKENKYIYVYETCSDNRCYYDGMYNKIKEILDLTSKKKYSIINNITEDQYLNGSCGHFCLTKLIMLTKYGIESFNYPIDKNSVIEETKLIYLLSYLRKESFNN